MNTNLINLKELDPAVAAMLEKREKTRKLQKLPTKERMAKLREMEKYQARQERRAGYDLDPDVIGEVKAIAEKSGTSASQVANLGLHLFLEAYGKGEVDITRYRTPAGKNPRWDWNLDWTKR